MCSCKKEDKGYQDTSPSYFLDWALFSFYGRSVTSHKGSHWTAFEGSSFVYFLELGPLTADWATLHQVVTDWDETKQRFRSQGILHSFMPSWIHGHTFLPVVGRSVNKTVEETPLWIGISKIGLGRRKRIKQERRRRSCAVEKLRL